MCESGIGGGVHESELTALPRDHGNSGGSAWAGGLCMERER